MGKRLLENPDHWSDIVGMPDDWDKENISNIIKNFKRKKFTFTTDDGKKHIVKGDQWINAAVKDAIHSHRIDKARRDKANLKITETDTRLTLTMPPELWKEIAEAYPTMFRDRKHHDWFLKNFPEFGVLR